MSMPSVQDVVVRLSDSASQRTGSGCEIIRDFFASDAAARSWFASLLHVHFDRLDHTSIPIHGKPVDERMANEVTILEYVSSV